MTMETEELTTTGTLEPTPPTEVVPGPEQPLSPPATAEVPAPSAQPASPAAQTPAPAATPVSPSIQTLPPEVQEYVARLEQQAQSARSQNEIQVLNQVVSQMAQEMAQELAATYQVTPEQALPFAQKQAQRQGDILYKNYQAEQMQKGKVRAAIAIAKEFSVDPLQLIDLPSPQAMQQMAQTLSGTTKQAQEVAALRAQVARLTKAAVPGQTFAQGAQPGAGASLTGDALEAAWLKHERAQPDRPNPYDSAYRAMLRG